MKIHFGVFFANGSLVEFSVWSLTCQLFKILVQGDVIGMTRGAYLICCNAIAAFCNLILKLCE